MGVRKRLIFSRISCPTNLQIHQAPIIVPKPTFGGSWVYSGLTIALLNGETRSFRIPTILILVLKLASISSLSVQKPTGIGITDVLRLSLWKFQTIRRSLPFNSSGNLNTAMETKILLIYSRNHYHQGT